MDNFWNTFASTSSNLPPNTADAKTIFADMRAALNRIADEERQQADALRTLALKHGFDLDAGDMMIAPKSLDLHIPVTMRERVRVSALATSITFINRAYVDPLMVAPSLFPRR